MSEQRPKDHRLVSHRLECAVQIGQKCNCGLEQESSNPKLDYKALYEAESAEVQALNLENERLRACKTQLENVLLYNALKDGFTILEANIKEALAATGRDHFDKELPADETTAAHEDTSCGYCALHYVGEGPLPPCDMCGKPYGEHGIAQRYPDKTSGST